MSIMKAADSRCVTLFLCGDVMTGRGIDQVLPHPSDPSLFEPYIRSATEYVRLAEEANGPLPRPIDFAYVWGDALPELDRRRPDARIINLETAVTNSDQAAPKGINYRMSPANFPCITAAGVDCCVLANNHVLDWGHRGLLDTLQMLRTARVVTVGAGPDARAAAAPAVLPVPSKGRVVVFAFGAHTSGVPRRWAATADKPGVNFLPDLSPATARGIARQVAAVKQPGDTVLLSLHWGPNWGYQIARPQREFAHRLIEEGGVDILFGHSSHHVKGIEVYQGKPILYGCGDFLNDYEGIRGYEEFRDDLVLMYFPTIDVHRGVLLRLAMIPLQIRRFRLGRATRTDTIWLRDVLNREGKRLNTRARLGPDHELELEWD